MAGGRGGAAACGQTTCMDRLIASVRVRVCETQRDGVESDAARPLWSGVCDLPPTLRLQPLSCRVNLCTKKGLQSPSPLLTSPLLTPLPPSLLGVIIFHTLQFTPFFSLPKTHSLHPSSLCCFSNTVVFISLQ